MRPSVLLAQQLGYFSQPSVNVAQVALNGLLARASLVPGWSQSATFSSSSSSSSSSSNSPQAYEPPSSPSSSFSFQATPTSLGQAAFSSQTSFGSDSKITNTSHQAQAFPSSPSQAPYTALSPPAIISPTLCRVVVIGWMGCKRKYLQKYSNLWLQSGDHEVLNIRPTVPMTLFRWRGVVTAGADIDRVARMHIENGGMPTIYHIFSTGGFIHAATMWKWMDQVEDIFIRKSLLDEVKGIIFDSGPAKVTEDMVAKALVSATLDTPAHVLESRPVQGRLLSAAHSAASWYMQKKYIRRREQEVHEAWYEMAPVCPQLYLYSASDTLANPHDVERYMQIQASRGVEVSSYKWQDSGHCEHYRRYPHDYAFQISQFAKHALRDW